MSGYNLTPNQKDVLRWIVAKVQEGVLAEEFWVHWIPGEDGVIMALPDDAGEDSPTLTPGVLDAFESNNLMLIERNITMQRGGRSQREARRRCTVTDKAFRAVNSDFEAPDTSFVQHLTPLADITNLDDDIKNRCLPILGAGPDEPMLWDSAVRTAGVILEDRLREVGAITDKNRVGRDLVNDIFGNSGSLSSVFDTDSERQGYRDLYAGIVGAFRNESAHQLVDPTPKDGGAFIVFVNLLLAKLDSLREDKEGAAE